MKRVREQPRPRVSGGFRLCSAVVALLLAVVVPAEVPVPALAARVTDLTGTLAAGEAAALEQKLAAFEQRKGTQIAVLVVATTAPETIEQFGIRVAEAWRLGRKGVDDGVLLLIAKDDRTLRIEVGYGLEGVLPDATARRIIDESIVPHFRAGDFAGGIDAGLERIMALIDGEPLPEPVRSRGRGGGLEGLGAALPVVFIFTLTFGTLLKRLMGQLPGALATGGMVGLLAWVLIGALSLAILAALAAFVLTLASHGGPGGWSSGRRGGSGWGGGFGGGGFGGGGFGGGGFSGGGGGFGGGGSSGRW